MVLLIACTVILKTLTLCLYLYTCSYVYISEKIVAELVTESAFSSERPDSYRIQAVPVYLRGILVNIPKSNISCQ